jgi:hypothetical protein
MAQELEQRAEAAYEVDVRIKANVKQLRTLWVQIAEDLFKVWEGQLWQDLGHPSFEHWLADPDIDISKRHVYGYIEAWRELVVKRDVEPAQLQEVGIGAVREVLPAIRRGFVDVDEGLSDAKTLGRTDLRTKYASSSSPGPAGQPRAHEPLDASMEPNYAICPTCGSRYEVET